MRNYFLITLVTISIIIQPIDCFSTDLAGEQLQVQSVFSPIIDDIGHVYETQIRLEIALIILSALNKTGTPWHDINADLDFLV